MGLTMKFKKPSCCWVTIYTLGIYSFLLPNGFTGRSYCLSKSPWRLQSNGFIPVCRTLKWWVSTISYAKWCLWRRGSRLFINKKPEHLSIQLIRVVRWASCLNNTFLSVITFLIFWMFTKCFCKSVSRIILMHWRRN